MGDRCRDCQCAVSAAHRDQCRACYELAEHRRKAALSEEQPAQVVQVNIYGDNHGPISL